MEFRKDRLKLVKIIKLFPNCKSITIIDGDKYKLIPQGLEFENTIYGKIVESILYINSTKHALKKIKLETTNDMHQKLLNKAIGRLGEFGWKHKMVEKTNDERIIQYEMWRSN